MAKRYHIRVCTVGTEEDIKDLLHSMILCCGEEEDESDGLEPYHRRDELLEQIRRLSRSQGGHDEGFLYDMITPTPFGGAELESATLKLREEPCGLWSACFDYHSAACFQAEDWLWMHLHCNMLQFAAQYAGEEFALEKGRCLISGGKVMDNWDCMAETWFWLIRQYISGEVPDGIPEELEKIHHAMEAEDFDMTVEELLCSCETNLRLLDEEVADTAALTERLQKARETNDWSTLSSLYLAVTESVLWETERNARWLSCLELARQSWAGRF